MSLSLEIYFSVLWGTEFIHGYSRVAYGVVVSMFDFHRSDRGSNPGRGGKIS